jgi:glycosyltransferase involved in cell wall biosynthesis
MSRSKTLTTRTIPKIADEAGPSIPLVVNCAYGAMPGTWFDQETEGQLRWIHFNALDDRNSFLLKRHVTLRRFVACFLAARAAHVAKADIVVTQGPDISYIVQYFSRLFGYRGPHLAFTFNYPWLPKGFQKILHRRGFSGIDRFVVYSNMERRLYHEYFSIPLERFEFLHWGVGPPNVDSPDKPIMEGDYVCAIGRNSRDYRTFIESVKRLPEMQVVMVVRPDNLAGLDIPPNVRVLAEIPIGQAMNILAFSRFMVLPLDGKDIPCGHMTIVHAMHLGKALAATRSSGISDYMIEEETALAFPPKNVDKMTEVLQRMWNDQELCKRLGNGGRAFAAEYCSEARTFFGFSRMLREMGIALEDVPDAVLTRDTVR